MGPGEVLIAFLFMGGAAYVLRPLAVAISRRISGEHRRKAIDEEDSDDVRAELHEVRRELAELAERMDFAERMLAKPRDVGGAR